MYFSTEFQQDDFSKEDVISALESLLITLKATEVELETKTKLGQVTNSSGNVIGVWLLQK